MADEILGLVIGAFFLQFMLIVPILIVMRAGGPKIVMWRILHINYVSLKVYDHDGTPFTKTFKMADIKTLSPPHVYFKGLIRYLDSTNFTRHLGGPMNQYNIDNALPLPTMRGYRDTILDPVTVTKTLNTDILRRFLNLSKEANPKNKPHTFRNIIIIVVILTMIAAAFASTRLHP